MESAASSCIMQVGEGLVQLIRSDTLDIEVEPLIKRLVEEPPDSVATLFVQSLRVGSQIQGAHQHLDADRQFRPGRRQVGFDGRAIVPYVTQSGFDFVLGKLALNGDVEQSLLLGVQLFQPSLHTGVHRTDTGLFICQRSLQQRPNVCRELGRQLYGGVVVDDGLLDLFHREVGEIAKTLLTSAAQEVSVEVAGPILRLGVDQTGSPVRAMTALAEE
ncbi:hypothetical protein [Nocardia sp. BMG111209]|uniref:hypothetical protein n=1 Tax=Nocardia sp. BMG111209 TaxID=1160137 RepID=UPI0007C4FC80|nr:hypothetical protein [Nocardia sp. BMG111209]